ncbi:MULE domain-containing protein [Aphis craccivora]|uniref:MULE domain-containing protein n=1 Tax=Aphis craccivora TaxID=307492 RepID=A0A6G0VLW2_APHCR|nr:MULE domain-containing protein [Aphis craccivora]
MGCRFYVTQSWLRAIQIFGLTEVYKKKTEVGDWLRICFGLVFLDFEDVSNFSTIELMSIKPENSKLTQFADYILDTYITEEALFPPNIWAQFSAELNLTTNACKSFHSHLAQSFANTQ